MFGLTVPRSSANVWRGIRSALVGVSMVLLPLAAARAQSLDAVLMGTLSDESAAGLPGATVTVTRDSTGVTRSAVADEAGRYVFLNLPAGTYTVRAELDGFAPTTRRAQPLYVGTTATLDFALPLASVAEHITVRGALPLLETTKNSLSRIVQTDEIDALPVISRNFNDLAALAPGVTKTGLYGGVDISGGRDFQNAYQLDGVSAERQHLGDQRIAYAQDWVQEFQVLTGQYNVEFGQAAGGVLNAITRSGGNQFTGRAYGFFREEAWDAKPAFASRKPPLDEYRVGATVGGPIVKNRIFYFGGVERFDNRSSSVVNSTFASANGTFPSTDERTLTLAKIEMFAHPAHTLRLRHNGYRQQTTGASVGGISTEEHGRFSKVQASELVAGWTWVMSPSSLNEARIAWGATTPQGGCNFALRNPPGTWFERAYPGAQFGCPVNFGTSAERQLQLIDNLFWTHGRHDVKLGIQTAWTTSIGDFRNFRDGRYAFDRDLPFDPGDAETYPFSFVMIEGPTTWDLSAWSAGIFVQDNWRITDDFALNVGVRYDVDGSLTALNPVVRLDKGLHTIRADVNNLAPRVGLAWTPLPNDKRTLLRGGGGLYYDQNHNNVATVLLLNNILVDRIVSLNANSPLLNPFWPDIQRAKSFLAAALADNRVPDVSMLGPVISTTNDVDENLQIPVATQISGGLAREFHRSVNASIDVVYTRGADLYVIRNVNLDPVTLHARNPNYTSINSFGSGGTSRYTGLHLQANVIPNAKHFLKLAYTLSLNRSNTNTTLSGGSATNPFDYSEDEGPSDNDVRHNLTVNGSATLPFDIQLSGIASYRGALPFSATTTAPRPDGQPFGFRPEPRNARRGDSAVSIDVRIGKVFRLGAAGSLVTFVEVFNLTNHVNYDQYIGTVTSSRFGQPTTAGPPRRTQLGIRFDF